MRDGEGLINRRKEQEIKKEIRKKMKRGGGNKGQRERKKW